jgi:sugar phosphate isomerase/epimerase
MKLSVSNIAWKSEKDEEMYKTLHDKGFQGLEIAPTRIFPQSPYDHLAEASDFATELKEKYGLTIPSIQSIWYGRNECIWGEENDRKNLAEYTKKAVDFAVTVNCSNLVFGCPRNRNIPENGYVETANAFFKEIGDYAHSRGTCIGLEANPVIYNTNFINTTKEAIDFILKTGSCGLRLNLDLGTMIQNSEEINVLDGYEDLINHVHISEPGLASVRERSIHRELKFLLEDTGYQGFVSIEMGSKVSDRELRDSMSYVTSIFG